MQRLRIIFGSVMGLNSCESETIAFSRCYHPLFIKIDTHMQHVVITLLLC